MAKKAAKAVDPKEPDEELDDDEDVPQPAAAPVPVVDDPFKRLKIAGFGFLLICGWAFVLGTNRFHITAPVVFACLAYTALITAIVNLWRTGASAAGPTSLDREWGRPLGARGELEKEKKTLLKGIKEAEFDAATNKLSKADADSLIKEYRARAIEVIKELDRLDEGAALSPKEQIAREVRARIELDKPKPAKKSESKAAKPDAPKPDANVDAKRDANVDARARDSAEPKADANVDAKGVAAEPTPGANDASARTRAGAKVAAELDEAASAKVAAAEAKVAAARAAAEAAEAKAAAARAEAEAAEAKAEAAKLASKATPVGEPGQGGDASHATADAEKTA